MSNENELIEGLLYKYTNVMKGWQYRWFSLSPRLGTLEYYMSGSNGNPSLSADKRKPNPRGCIYLAGCLVAPLEEDSQTFTVSAACGEVYKLKAPDAKQRQFWVDKLRLVAEMHENQIAEQHPPIKYHTETISSLNDVRDTLLQTQKSQRSLMNAIESYTNTDESLLLLKATSYSTVMALEQCFAILQSIQNQRP